MGKDPVKELAGRWLEKFSNPSNSVHCLAHARRVNSAAKFSPDAVLKLYRKTSSRRMVKLATATRELAKQTDKNK